MSDSSKPKTFNPTDAIVIGHRFDSFVNKEPQIGETNPSIDEQRKQVEELANTLSSAVKDLLEREFAAEVGYAQHGGTPKHLIVHRVKDILSGSRDLPSIPETNAQMKEVNNLVAEFGQRVLDLQADELKEASRQYNATFTNWTGGSRSSANTGGSTYH